jgi:hypothetical protein
MNEYYNPYDLWNADISGSDEEKMMLSGCLRSLCTIIAMVIAMLICSLFCSCSSVKYVPVVQHKTDTFYLSKNVRDSIYLRDSVSIIERGETVRIEKWHTRYVSREVHDTTYLSKTDSIPTPYPVEVIKEVDKPLTWWQRVKMFVGLSSLIIITLLFIAYLIIKKFSL